MSLTAVAAVCLCTAVLAVMLKQYKPEYAVLITLAAGVVTLALVLYGLSPVLDKLRGFSDQLGGMGQAVEILVKALGICYLAQFAADACRDAGETSLAAKVELAGKIAVVVLSLPMLEQVMEIIIKLMG